MRDRTRIIRDVLVAAATPIVQTHICNSVGINNKVFMEIMPNLRKQGLIKRSDRAYETTDKGKLWIDLYDRNMALLGEEIC